MISHENYLKRAMKQAVRTQDMKRQFGAVIVDRKKVIAEARNMRSHPKIPNVIHPVTLKRYWGLHAEIAAMLRCPFNISGTTMYVWGQNIRSSKTVFSKPCELCYDFIKKRGIKTVVFTTYTGYEVMEIGK
jgi:deoxycytidylate deaminase